jgi:DNA-binding NarL/FixJ family response regulator
VVSTEVSWVSTSDDVVRIGILHPLQAWLDALECVLRADDRVEVVVAHNDPAWIRNAVERADVDLVLISLSEDLGVEPVRAMLRGLPGVEVVVISDSDEAAFISDVVRAGARGWLRSSATIEDLVDVVQGVSRGESWFPPKHVTKLVNGLLESERTRVHRDELLDALSSREREILECLARGMSRHEIAEQLFISSHTVRTHINHVLHKLDVHSTLAAVTLARKP